MVHLFGFLGLVTLLLSAQPILIAEGHAPAHDVAAGHAPRIVAGSNGHLHVVFQTDDAIACSESTDLGATWGAPTVISKSAGAAHPDVAIDSSGALDVVWSGTKDVYFAWSSDGGRSWTEPTDVSNTTDGATAMEPAVAAGPGDLVNVAWIDSRSGAGHPDVFVSTSTDRGRSWSSPEDVSNTPGVSSKPTISVGTDSIIHVAWLDTTSGADHPDIFYSRKLAGKWSPYKNISDSPKVSSHPSLSSSENGHTYLVWTDNSRKENAADVWCVRIGHSSKASKALNISNTPGVSSQAAISTGSRGRVAVVWSDTTSGATMPDIYTRVSGDNLDDISAAVDLTKTSGQSLHPHAAIAGDTLLVVWEEVTDGHSVIKQTSMRLTGIPMGPSFGVDSGTVNGHQVQF